MNGAQPIVPSVQPTVRVRIAVAVNAEGKWACAGSPGESDRRNEELATWRLAYGKDTEAIVHFVEADVPLPVSQTVEGQVAGPDMVPRENEADE